MTLAYLFFDSANTLAPTSPTLPTSVGVGIVCAYLVTFVKRAKQIPWITFYSTKINTLIRAGTSFLSTIGVTVSWSSVTHTLTIGNLTLAVVVGGIYHWVVQFGIQQIAESSFQSMQIGTLRSQKENLDPHLTA